MKLTPIKLYTVNHRGDPEQMPADAVVWAATPEEAVTRFLAGEDGTADRIVHVNGDTYRIDSNAAPVPSFGWVPGEPPKDGAWYLVQYGDDFNDPSPGVARFSSGQAEYVDDDGQSYADNLITHYNPTPISLETP